MTTKRIVSWFSCGAASAIATKLAIVHNRKNGIPFIVAYRRVRGEHPNNIQFLKECEVWLGQEIITLRTKKARIEFEQIGDLQVFGYTIEEQKRIDRFIDANPSVNLWCPLIDSGLTKEDCKAMMTNAGIELPKFCGKYHNEPMFQRSIFCHLAEQDIK